MQYNTTQLPAGGVPKTVSIYFRIKLPLNILLILFFFTGFSTNVLQHAKIPHQSREVCQRVFSEAGVTITHDHICAGGENQIDTCKGDSGGPLFATVPFKIFNSLTINRQVQFGIVSFGLTGCGGKNVNAAAYSNLFKYMPWITKIIGNNT